MKGYELEDSNIRKHLKSETSQVCKSSRNVTPQLAPVASEADELEFEIPGYFLKLSRGDRVGLNTEDPMRSGRIAI
jgi:hypothetical protein